jgi:hypothetical protein
MNIAKIEKLLWPAGRGDAPRGVKMSKSDKVENLRKALDHGDLAHVERATWHRVIEDRAEKIRKGGETAEQAYSRAIETDEISKICLKAHQSAPLLKVAVSSSAEVRALEGKRPSPPLRLGSMDPKEDDETADAKLERKARRRMRKTGETYEKAFSEVYADKANSEIVRQSREGHLAKAIGARGF